MELASMGKVSRFRIKKIGEFGGIRSRNKKDHKGSQTQIKLLS